MTTNQLPDNIELWPETLAAIELARQDAREVTDEPMDEADAAECGFLAAPTQHPAEESKSPF